jgi:hypothetical protein
MPGSARWRGYYPRRAVDFLLLQVGLGPASVGKSELRNQQARLCAAGVCRMVGAATSCPGPLKHRSGSLDMRISGSTTAQSDVRQRCSDKSTPPASRVQLVEHSVEAGAGLRGADPGRHWRANPTILVAISTALASPPLTGEICVEMGQSIDELGRRGA